MCSIKKDDWIDTPRFCKVKIEKIFESSDEARCVGYIEPTHYRNPDYEILGKPIGINRMKFAAAKK